MPFRAGFDKRDAEDSVPCKTFYTIENHLILNGGVGDPHVFMGGGRDL